VRRALARHLKEWTYGLVAREISQITRYADRVVHVDPLPSDTGLLLDGLDAPAKYMGASEAAAGILRDERTDVRACRCARCARPVAGNQTPCGWDSLKRRETS
jgi:hypothetical protein